MLIYANKRENNQVDFTFFASKGAYLIDNLKKIIVKKAQAKEVKCAKTNFGVPRTPVHLSFNMKT